MRASRPAQGGARKTKAGLLVNGGDVVTTRIGNVPTRGMPANGAKPLATLSRNEEFVVFGGEQSGYISVLGSEATGWVKKALLARQ